MKLETLPADHLHLKNADQNVMQCTGVTWICIQWRDKVVKVEFAIVENLPKMLSCYNTLIDIGELKEDFALPKKVTNEDNAERVHQIWGITEALKDPEGPFEDEIERLRLEIV